MPERYRFLKRLIVITVCTMFVLMTGVGLLFCNYVNSYSQDKKLLNNNADNDNIINSLIDEIERSTNPININNNTNILFLSGASINEVDFCGIININRQRKEITAMILPPNTGINKDDNFNLLNSLFSIYKGKKINASEALEKENIQNSINDNIPYIENAFDIQIDYYCFFHERTIIEAINALGGVEYYVPIELNYSDPYKGLFIHLEEGMQILDGKAALDYLKFIKSNKQTKGESDFYDGSQQKRITAQEEFLKELFKQKNSITYIKRLIQISDSLLSDVVTSLDSEILLKLLPPENFFIGYDFVTCEFPGNEKIVNNSLTFIKNSYELSRKTERYFK